MVYAGIDVGSKSLVVSRVLAKGRRSQRTFSNTRGGCRDLVRWLAASGEPVRAVLEATGVYSQSITWVLHDADGIEVMVANPHAIKHFAGARMVRAKTDQVDADVIAEFAQCMPFVAWQPPATAALELRSISRRIGQLTGQITAERNRLHANDCAADAASVVTADIEATVDFLQTRVAQLRREAQQIIAAKDTLADAYALLLSICGVAEASAIPILAELSCLPDGLSAAQWVAHAGLDPRPIQSGTSINRPARLSKAGNRYLRTALFMPAMVAARHEPQVAAFRDRLVNKGKKAIQAIAAIMRKLLLAIYGMFKHGSTWNPQLAFPKIAPQT